MGGYKDVSFAVKARGTVGPGDGPWARLKYEGGVHRVQRVPVTESQGRIHTSAAGVHVLPEAEEVEVEVDPNDLRIDVFRSSGPGRAERQHHRLGRAHHPRAHRHRRVLPEREEPAAEQGAGAAHPAGPAAGRRPGGGRPGGVRRAAQPGAHRRPLRAGPHLQLRREPDRRPPGELQGLQPRPGARRRPRRRRPGAARRRHRGPAGDRRASDATCGPALAAAVARLAARRASRRRGSTPRSWPRSRWRWTARELWRHDAPGSRTSRRTSTAGPLASRCSTSPAGPTSAT